MPEARSWRQVGLPFLVLRLGGQAGEFVAFIVLARDLDAASFGRLSMAFLVARYLGLVADWGASVRGARDVARGDDAEAIDALLRRRERVATFLTAAFVAGAFALGGQPYVSLAAVVAARGLNRDWVSLGQGRGHASGASSMAQGAALLALTVVVRTPAQAAAAVAGGYLVGLVVSLGANRHLTRPDAEHRGQPNPRVDGWFLGAVLADQVTISADTLLLGWLRDASAAGIYAAVYRIPNAWMTLIGLTVLGVLPRTTKLLAGGSHEDTKGLRRQAIRAGSIAGAIILTSAVPAYLLVPIVFGEAYASGRTPLLILMVATAVMAIAASMHPLYVALAKDRDVFTLSFAAALVNLAANAIAIPAWGMVGAAMATFATQTMLLAIVVVRLRQLLP